MKPLTVQVCIRVAKDAADANAQCKTSEAYRSILAKYPSATWDRKWVKTEVHPQNGLWMVEFQVSEKSPQ